MIIIIIISELKKMDKQKQKSIKVCLKYSWCHVSCMLS